MLRCVLCMPMGLRSNALKLDVLVMSACLRGSVTCSSRLNLYNVSVLLCVQLLAAILPDDCEIDQPC